MDAGIDEVLVLCVNDGAVMQAWAKDLKVAGTMVTLLADTRSELTKALGMVLDHAGVLDVRSIEFVFRLNQTVEAN